MKASIGRFCRHVPRPGVGGGASYDGLVALEARAHDRVLLTRDTRAQDIYRRLGVASRASA